MKTDQCFSMKPQEQKITVLAANQPINFIVTGLTIQRQQEEFQRIYGRCLPLIESACVGIFMLPIVVY
jgi:hypothetical protein